MAVNYFCRCVSSILFWVIIISFVKLYSSDNIFGKNVATSRKWCTGCGLLQYLHTIPPNVSRTFIGCKLYSTDRIALVWSEREWETATYFRRLSMSKCCYCFQLNKSQIRVKWALYLKKNHRSNLANVDNAQLWYRKPTKMTLYWIVIMLNVVVMFLVC